MKKNKDYALFNNNKVKVSVVTPDIKSVIDFEKWILSIMVNENVKDVKLHYDYFGEQGFWTAEPVRGKKSKLHVSYVIKGIPNEKKNRKIQNNKTRK